MQKCAFCYAHDFCLFFVNEFLLQFFFHLLLCVLRRKRAFIDFNFGWTHWIRSGFDFCVLLFRREIYLNHIYLFVQKYCKCIDFWLRFQELLIFCNEMKTVNSSWRCTTISWIIHVDRRMQTKEANRRIINIIFMQILTKETLN